MERANSGYGGGNVCLTWSLFTRIHQWGFHVLIFQSGMGGTSPVSPQRPQSVNVDRSDRISRKSGPVHSRGRSGSAALVLAL